MNLKVTARLAGPIAGDAPRLDSLLEIVMSRHTRKPADRGALDRNAPCPPPGDVRIPLLRRELGPWLVGCCSDPIYGAVRDESVDRIARSITPSNAGLLDGDSSLRIPTSSGWTKSCLIPLRVRLVDEVVWFATGDRRSLYNTLRHGVRFLGKKAAVGYGRVASWDVERVEHDWTWYAPHESGTLLMATLPDGEWLPLDLTGYRRDYGGAAPPYWHPDRFAEIVVPC